MGTGADTPLLFVGNAGKCTVAAGAGCTRGGQVAGVHGLP